MKTLKERILDDVGGVLFKEFKMTYADIDFVKNSIRQIEYGEEGNEININLRVTHMPDLYIRQKKDSVQKKIGGNIT